MSLCFVTKERSGGGWAAESPLSNAIYTNTDVRFCLCESVSVGVGLLMLCSGKHGIERHFRCQGEQN